MLCPISVNLVVHLPKSQKQAHVDLASLRNGVQEISGVPHPFTVRYRSGGLSHPCFALAIPIGI